MYFEKKNYTQMHQNKYHFYALLRKLFFSLFIFLVLKYMKNRKDATNIIEKVEDFRRKWQLN